MKLAFEIPLVFAGQNHIDDVPGIAELFEAGLFARLGLAVFELVVAYQIALKRRWHSAIGRQRQRV